MMFLARLTILVWTWTQCVIVICDCDKPNCDNIWICSPVHVTKFTSDNLHIFSGSDDCSVKLWDIPSESEVVSYSEHQVKWWLKILNEMKGKSISYVVFNLLAQQLFYKNYIKAGYSFFNSSNNFEWSISISYFKVEDHILTKQNCYKFKIKIALQK